MGWIWKILFEGKLYYMNESFYIICVLIIFINACIIAMKIFLFYFVSKRKKGQKKVPRTFGAWIINEMIIGYTDSVRES